MVSIPAQDIEYFICTTREIIHNLNTVFHPHQHPPVTVGIQRQLQVPNHYDIDSWIIKELELGSEKLPNMPLDSFWDSPNRNDSHKFTDTLKGRMAKSKTRATNQSIFHINDERPFDNPGELTSVATAKSTEPLFFPLKRLPRKSNRNIRHSTEKSNEIRNYRNATDADISIASAIPNFAHAHELERTSKPSFKFSKRESDAYILKENSELPSRSKSLEPRVTSKSNEQFELIFCSYCAFANDFEIDITIRSLSSITYDYSLEVILPRGFQFEDSKKCSGKSIFKCSKSSPWKRKVHAKFDELKLKEMLEEGAVIKFHLLYSNDSTGPANSLIAMGTDLDLSVTDFFSIAEGPQPTEFANILRNQPERFSISGTKSLVLPTASIPHIGPDFEETVFNFILNSLRLSTVERLGKAMTLFGVFLGGSEDNENAKVAGLITLSPREQNSITPKSEESSQMVYRAINVELKSSESWIIRQMLEKLDKDFNRFYSVENF